MAIRTLARPYAKAAFACSNNAKSHKQWLEFLQAASSITNAAIIPELEDILPMQQYNFLCVLKQMNRLDLLPEIAKIFEQLYLESNNSIAVKLTTATKLDDNAEKKFQVKLTEVFKKNVVLEYDVDPKLLGGYIARSGSDVIDSSIKTALIAMQKSFSSQEGIV